MADFPQKLTRMTGKSLAYTAIGFGIVLGTAGSWLLRYHDAAEPLAWRLVVISFLPICAGLCYQFKVRGYNPALPLLMLFCPPAIWGMSHAPAGFHADTFPFDCIFYLLSMGIVHFIIFVLGYFVLFVISALSRKQCQFLGRRVRHFALFNFLLLIVGCSFSTLWTGLIFGNLYWSYDSLGDFVPFWPITRSVIDYGADVHGELFGISLLELQLVWLAFAVCTWATTFYLYKLFLRTHASLKQSPDREQLAALHST